MIRRILVPVDGSGHANKAIGFAAYLARAENAGVDLLHVVKSTKIPKEIRDYVESERLEESPNALYSKQMGSKIVSGAEGYAKKMGIKKIETAILQGDPAEMIINYAHHRDFDIIIIGKRGLGNEQGPGLGSVTNRISNETDLPCVIVKKDLLDGKRILVVDDEPDILETLEGLLENCEVEKASNFEKAKELLETQHFDIAILDIMGVNGYELLKVANKRKVPAAMLTSHALSPENTLKSFVEGAAYFIPKDQMTNVAAYLKDVLEAREEGKHFWSRWIDRFGSYYSKKFGPEWQDKQTES